MRLATRQQWLSYLVALRFAAVLGAVFGALAGPVLFKPALTGALFGAIGGVVDSTAGMAFIGAAEIFPAHALAARWYACRSSSAC
jgi:hypothetical protein